MRHWLRKLITCPKNQGNNKEGFILFNLQRIQLSLLFHIPLSFLCFSFIVLSSHFVSLFFLYLSIPYLFFLLSRIFFSFDSFQLLMTLYPICSFIQSKSADWPRPPPPPPLHRADKWNEIRKEITFLKRTYWAYALSVLKPVSITKSRRPIIFAEKQGQHY